MAGPDLPVTPDADRRPFTGAELDAASRHAGTAYYVHDTPAVRFIILDTVCTAGGADGCIDEDQVGWLELRLKEARDRPVVITSHHTLDTTANQRRAGGSRYGDAGEVIERVHAAGNLGRCVKRPHHPHATK